MNGRWLAESAHLVWGILLVTACASSQPKAISPAEAAEEVADEAHDADPFTPAEKPSQAL